MEASETKETKFSVRGVCLICNMEVNNLSNHISMKHIKNSEIKSLQEYYHKYIIRSDVRPVCLNCGKEVSFISITKGYKRVCSHKCAMNAPEIKEFIQSRAKEGLRALGVENISQLPGSRDKMKQTKLRNYGSENYTNKEKAKKTNIERYGVDHYMKTKEGQQKLEETSLKKYKTRRPSQSQEVKDKVKETVTKNGGYTWQREDLRKNFLNFMKERYGGLTFQSKELREKVRQTNIERYGTEYPTQNVEVRNKTKETNLKRYGLEYTLQNPNILMRLYGVTDINQLEWVVEKQKKNRLITLQERYQVENVSQLAWVVEKVLTTKRKKYKDGIYDFTYQKYLKQNGENILYQSDLELKFIQHCEEKGIIIQRGDAIRYTFDNKNRIYFVDFKIKENDKWRLIEIKDNYIWWKEDLKTGRALAKVIAAQEHSLNYGYLPYKILLGKDFIETEVDI
jgi:hypothetical protein